MRAPRGNELQLMATLRDGPKAITVGPIGRCVKRGWCRIDLHTAAGKAVVIFDLTETGRAVLRVAQEAASGLS